MHPFRGPPFWLSFADTPQNRPIHSTQTTLFSSSEFSLLRKCETLPSRDGIHASPFAMHRQKNKAKPRRRGQAVLAAKASSTRWRLTLFPAIRAKALTASTSSGQAEIELVLYSTVRPRLVPTGLSAPRHSYPHIRHATKMTTAMMMPRTTFFRMSFVVDIKPPLRVKYRQTVRQAVKTSRTTLVSRASA